jgi:CubicO group peptidase (beta-lactamase class C family)
MKLADRKVLDLDRPLARYLPPEKVAAILGHPLDEPGFRRDWLEKVTARHVLSHSAGFPHGESGRPFPLAFEPGTTWKYSADGYFYLQRAVEHLKGATLDALMQKEVLEPLGMTRSAMAWRPAFEHVVASGHGLLGRPEATRRRTEAHAGATLYTTAGDYARFLCAVLNGEGLAPGTLEEMIAPRIDMDKAKGLGWSLGFGTQSDANGLALWQWGDYGIFRNYAIAYPGRRTGVVYLANSFYGLGVAPAIVARSMGGQALGGVALNYQPYDSPLYRFVWDVQEKGPAAVNELDRLRRENPGLFVRDWVGYFASSFLEAGMMPQALALLEADLRDHPRSGKAAVAVAEACLKTGDRAKARRHFELALDAAEEKVDAAVAKRRLEYLAALHQPAPADLAGTWSGVMWTNDEQIDLVAMAVEKRGAGYEATLADSLGLIPAGTKTGPFAWTGGEVAFSFTIPLEGGMEIRTRLAVQGATLKGRWEDVKHGNSGPVELALAPRRP